MLGAAFLIGTIAVFLVSLRTERYGVLVVELVVSSACFLGMAVCAGLLWWLISEPSPGERAFLLCPAAFSLFVAMHLGRRAFQKERAGKSHA